MMLRRARYCHGKLSIRLFVRPSVRLSVTLRYRGHIGWNFATIISRLISVAFLLFADPNIMDLFQREPTNFSRNRSGVWKIGKTGNVSETVEDRSKVTINGLY